MTSTFHKSLKALQQAHEHYPHRYQLIDIDSEDAPDLFALSSSFTLQSSEEKHIHEAGQLFCLKQGLMMVESKHGFFVNPPRFIAWIPPDTEHSFANPGPIEGWTVFIKKERTKNLPDHPALLDCSELLEPLAKRLAGWAVTDFSSNEYQRMSEVFLDELQHSTIQPFSLPLPEDAKLRKIATLLIENPANYKTGSELASWVGMSSRSLTRHWMNAVGISLTQYRQLSRLLNSINSLSKGKDVQQVAWEVGYESVSAYITAFKKNFGFTPGKYLSNTQ